MLFDVEEQPNSIPLSCKVVRLSIWIVADVGQKNVPLWTWIEAIVEIIQMTDLGRVDINMGRLLDNFLAQSVFFPYTG